MASQTPPSRRANGQGCTAMDGDMLYEILLRLPAKRLCRLRAVCRSWRSLLSAPSFIAAHRARQAAPLLVVHGRGRDADVRILDIASGESIKRVRTESTRYVSFSMMMLHTPDDLVGLPVPRTTGGLGLCVLDPATGTGFPLPDANPDKHSHHQSFMLWRASNGDSKVLYIGTSVANGQQLCKVLTLSGDRRWRETGCPPAKVMTTGYSDGAAAVKGIAYFLPSNSNIHDLGSKGYIMAYDLEKEVWRSSSLPTPAPGNKLEVHTLSHGLAELGGCLALVFEDDHRFMELWLLVDPDQVIWSRRCTITVPYRYQGVQESPLRVLVAKPLWLLDDGRIIFWMWMSGERPNAVLCIYDPRTMTYTDVADMRNYMLGGLYTGSLLG